MHDGQEGPAPEHGAPEPGDRRATTADAGSGALPAAGTVARVHAAVTGWSRGRKILALGSALVGGGLIAFGIATSGTADPGALAQEPVTTYADRVDPTPGARVPSGERPVADPPGSPGDTRVHDASRPPAASTDDPEERTGDEPATPGASAPHPGEPGTTAPAPETPAPTPGPSAPTNPGTPAPGTGTPAPGTPAPGTPAPGTPAPGTPSPGTPSPGTPAPGTPAPGTPAPTDPATAPAPLGFAGLTSDFVEVLGIKLIGSYTLSLTGQPGATASVTYGGRSVRSVTFDAAGRATATVGRSLVDLGLSNPTIRVAYTDGTAGAAIEAPRDSL
ncbi:hypothetical protein [Microbacterium sp. XT11]|uniref:hypothetical protein n=1 Tax=Microbacterium sp. XT11 TaxID=367477 RepID=UPI000742F0F8|nr:hypothetical protein [Microbacterium sp. XT11]ALX66075.1 putativevegetative cell wall protein gp1-like [Microbacterium sp. XT11]